MLIYRRPASDAPQALSSRRENNQHNQLKVRVLQTRVRLEPSTKNLNRLRGKEGGVLLLQTCMFTTTCNCQHTQVSFSPDSWHPTLAVFELASTSNFVARLEVVVHLITIARIPSVPDSQARSVQPLFFALFTELDAL